VQFERFDRLLMTFPVGSVIKLIPIIAKFYSMLFLAAASHSMATGLISKLKL